MVSICDMHADDTEFYAVQNGIERKKNGMPFAILKNLDVWHHLRITKVELFQKQQGIFIYSRRLFWW